MRGNVFERRIILPAGSGGLILFLKISRKRRAFQGGAAPALNHLARRSHQRLTSGHRCCTVHTAVGVSVLGSYHHHGSNQPHAVISDDRELGLLRACFAASLINSFFGRQSIRTLSHSLPPSRSSSSRLPHLSFASFPIMHWLLPNLPPTLTMKTKLVNLNSLLKLTLQFYLK